MYHQYHQTDYLTQGRGQEYYSKLIYTLKNSFKNRYMLFSEKSVFNNSDFLTQLKDNHVISNNNLIIVLFHTIGLRRKQFSDKNHMV